MSKPTSVAILALSLAFVAPSTAIWDTRATIGAAYRDLPGVAPHRMARGRVHTAATLIVRVLDDASGRPLMNADVIVVSTGEHRFTSEQGEARLPWPADGRLHLRVREIGYRFADSVVVRPQASPATTDTVTFALTRVAYNLHAVSASAEHHCASDGDSASRLLSASVLEQLRLGAERYAAFRDAYPFRVRVLRRTVKIGTDGKASNTKQGIETAWSETWGQPYEPDRVVQQVAGGFSVNILFIASLADPAFWTRHCFVVRGMDSRDGERLLRMEFTPTLDVRTPDWAGSALVDSATSVLRRVEFRLAGLGPKDMPRRLTGHTTFTSPSPMIVVPDTTIGMWWNRDSVAGVDWGMPDVAQLVHIVEIRYGRATPPQRRAP